MSEKVSWNDLAINEMFLGPGGLYQKLSEDKVFYFNGYTEMNADVEENKSNKVFERTDQKAPIRK